MSKPRKSDAWECWQKAQGTLVEIEAEMQRIAAIVSQSPAVPVPRHRVRAPFLSFVLRRPFADRWIIQSAERRQVAWAGSHWAAIGGDFQICNFATAEEARSYARERGLGPEVR